MSGALRKALQDRQCVLVLQGGGALGAYQKGVYQALHEAQCEPDWVIGTSIGAINAAIIAGNPARSRVEKLDSFWDRVTHRANPFLSAPFARAAAMADIFLRGIPGFFAPSMTMMPGPLTSPGAETAAFYSTKALEETLLDHVDFERIGREGPRLTVGAVSVTSGRMRYFDSRAERIGARHIMASGALPPAFPAVRIDGEPYWDGGIYSNSPVEAVFDDNPRRSSVVFSVQLWNGDGPEPATLWEVSSRQKEIQYASRIDSHIERQGQIHHMRHIINELGKHLPEGDLKKPHVRDLLGWGCQTEMHVIRLILPRLNGEDPLADADFSGPSLSARAEAGHAAARRALADQPWITHLAPDVGVMIRDYR